VQVADEFRVREQVERAFLQATSPAKSDPVLDIPSSTSIMAKLVVESTSLESLSRSDVSVKLDAPPVAKSVSPDPPSDSTSIAGLKARLAALQVFVLCVAS
jgi:hypothetical protein